MHCCAVAPGTDNFFSSNIQGYFGCDLMTFRIRKWTNDDLTTHKFASVGVLVGDLSIQLESYPLCNGLPLISAPDA
jgi:hypothetical protein